MKNFLKFILVVMLSITFNTTLTAQTKTVPSDETVTNIKYVELEPQQGVIRPGTYEVQVTTKKNGVTKIYKDTWQPNNQLGIEMPELFREYVRPTTPAGDYPSKKAAFVAAQKVEDVQALEKRLQVAKEALDKAWFWQRPGLQKEYENIQQATRDAQKAVAAATQQTNQPQSIIDAQAQAEKSKAEVTKAKDAADKAQLEVEKAKKANVKASKIQELEDKAKKAELEFIKQSTNNQRDQLTLQQLQDKLNPEKAAEKKAQAQAEYKQETMRETKKLVQQKTEAELDKALKLFEKQQATPDETYLKLSELINELEETLPLSQNEEITKIENNIQTKKQELAAKNAEIKSLQDDTSLTSQQKRIKQRKPVIDKKKIEAEIDGLELDLQQEKMKQRTTARQSGQLSPEDIDVLAKIDDTEKELAQLKKELEAKNIQQTDIKEQQPLNEKTTIKTVEQKSASNIPSNVQGNVNKINMNIEASEQRIKMLEPSRDSLKDAVASLQKSIKQLGEPQSKQAIAQLTALQEQQRDVEEKLRRVERQLADEQQKIKELTAQKQSLTGVAEQPQTQQVVPPTKKIEPQQKQTIQQVETLTKQAENAQKTAAQASQQNENLKIEAAELQKQLEQSEKKVEQLKTQQQATKDLTQQKAIQEQLATENQKLKQLQDKYIAKNTEIQKNLEQIESAKKLQKNVKEDAATKLKTISSKAATQVYNQVESTVDAGTAESKAMIDDLVKGAQKEVDALLKSSKKLEDFDTVTRKAIRNYYAKKALDVMDPIDQSITTQLSKQEQDKIIQQQLDTDLKRLIKNRGHKLPKEDFEKLKKETAEKIKQLPTQKAQEAETATVKLQQEAKQNTFKGSTIESIEVDTLFDGEQNVYVKTENGVETKMSFDEAKTKGIVSEDTPPGTYKNTEETIKAAQKEAATQDVIKKEAATQKTEAQATVEKLLSNEDDLKTYESKVKGRTDNLINKNKQEIRKTTQNAVDVYKKQAGNKATEVGIEKVIDDTLHKEIEKLTKQASADVAQQALDSGILPNQQAVQEFTDTISSKVLPEVIKNPGSTIEKIQDTTLKKNISGDSTVELLQKQLQEAVDNFSKNDKQLKGMRNDYIKTDPNDAQKQAKFSQLEKEITAKEVEWRDSAKKLTDTIAEAQKVAQEQKGKPAQQAAEELAKKALNDYKVIIDDAAKEFTTASSEVDKVIAQFSVNQIDENKARFFVENRLQDLRSQIDDLENYTQQLANKSQGTFQQKEIKQLADQTEDLLANIENEYNQKPEKLRQLIEKQDTLQAAKKTVLQDTPEGRKVARLQAEVDEAQKAVNETSEKLKAAKQEAESAWFNKGAKQKKVAELEKELKVNQDELARKQQELEKAEISISETVQQEAEKAQKTSAQKAAEEAKAKAEAETKQLQEGISTPLEETLDEFPPDELQKKNQIYVNKDGSVWHMTETGDIEKLTNDEAVSKGLIDTSTEKGKLYQNSQEAKKTVPLQKAKTEAEELLAQLDMQEQLDKKLEDINYKIKQATDDISIKLKDPAASTDDILKARKSLEDAKTELKAYSSDLQKALKTSSFKDPQTGVESIKYNDVNLEKLFVENRVKSAESSLNNLEKSLQETDKQITKKTNIKAADLTKRLSKITTQEEIAQKPVLKSAQELVDAPLNEVSSESLDAAAKQITDEYIPELDKEIKDLNAQLKEAKKPEKKKAIQQEIDAKTEERYKALDLAEQLENKQLELEVSPKVEEQQTKQKAAEAERIKKEAQQAEQKAKAATETPEDAAKRAAKEADDQVQQVYKEVKDLEAKLAKAKGTEKKNLQKTFDLKMDEYQKLLDVKAEADELVEMIELEKQIAPEKAKAEAERIASELERIEKEAQQAEQKAQQEAADAKKKIQAAQQDAQKIAKETAEKALAEGKDEAAIKKAVNEAVQKEMDAKYKGVTIQQNIVDEEVNKVLQGKTAPSQEIKLEEVELTGKVPLSDNQKAQIDANVQKALSQVQDEAQKAAQEAADKAALDAVEESKKLEESKITSQINDSVASELQKYADDPNNVINAYDDAIQKDLTKIDNKLDASTETVVKKYAKGDKTTVEDATKAKVALSNDLAEAMVEASNTVANTSDDAVLNSLADKAATSIANDADILAKGEPLPENSILKNFGKEALDKFKEATGVSMVEAAVKAAKNAYQEAWDKATKDALRNAFAEIGEDVTDEFLDELIQDSSDTTLKKLSTSNAKYFAKQFIATNKNVLTSSIKSVPSKIADATGVSTAKKVSSELSEWYAKRVSDDLKNVVTAIKNNKYKDAFSGAKKIIQNVGQDVVEKSLDEIGEKFGKKLGSMVGDQALDLVEEVSIRATKKVGEELGTEFSKEAAEMLSKKIGKEVAQEAGGEVAEMIAKKLATKIGTKAATYLGKLGAELVVKAAAKGGVKGAQAAILALGAAGASFSMGTSLIIGIAIDIAIEAVMLIPDIVMGAVTIDEQVDGLCWSRPHMLMKNLVQGDPNFTVTYKLYSDSFPEKLEYKYAKVNDMDLISKISLMDNMKSAEEELTKKGYKPVKKSNVLLVRRASKKDGVRDTFVRVQRDGDGKFIEIKDLRTDEEAKFIWEDKFFQKGLPKALKKVVATFTNPEGRESTLFINKNWDVDRGSLNKGYKAYRAKVVDKFDTKANSKCFKLDVDKRACAINPLWPKGG